MIECDQCSFNNECDYFEDNEFNKSNFFSNSLKFTPEEACFDCGCFFCYHYKNDQPEFCKDCARNS